MEDVTDFFGLGEKNDAVEGLFSFENDEKRENDDLLFNRRMEFDHFLNFENWN